MALSMIKSLKDTAGFVKALIEYLSLKNKELYSNSSGWKTGSKTIPGISKYKTVRVYFWSTTNGVLAERLNDTDESFQMRGASMMQGVSNNTQHTSGSVNLFCKGDSVEVYLETYMHQGYRIAQLGGGLHAVIEEVLAGHCRFFLNIKQQLEGWKHPDSMGHIDTKYRGKRQDKLCCVIPEKIFHNPESVYRISCKYELPRTVSLWRKTYYRNGIYNDISQPNFKRSNLKGKLACNRQGIVAARGCCYV